MSRPLEPPVKGPQLLISTANKHDRFNLLDDHSIPRPNIDIPIHPVFRASNFTNASPNTYRNLQQTLRLASMFLEHNSVLEWFVAPLLGLPLLDSQSGKTYLSDPLANKSKLERRVLVERVRAAFDCLSHSVHFTFLHNSDVKFYARTIFHDRLPTHRPTCTQHFKTRKAVKIEIRQQYYDFLRNHYTSSSFCEVLRHDFCLAVALVHELCHAIGVMRRNNLNEPHIRLDHLHKPEFGYAWEHFMFGGIINPFDRTSSKLSFLMRKIWADDSTAYAAGGKEWTAVPMSYIARWFQKDTWKVVARHGPTAIPTPAVHLKLRAHDNYYTVLSDDNDALADVGVLQREILHRYKPTGKYPSSAVAILTARVTCATPEELEKSTVPVPGRVIIDTAYEDDFVSPKGRSRPFGEMMVKSYSNPLPVSPRIALVKEQVRPKISLKRHAGADSDRYRSTAAGMASSFRPRKRTRC